MQLSDDEIRRILAQERRKIKKKKRKRRRISFLIILFVILITFIVVIIHREDLGLSSSKAVIFIDPGHGGDDPGSFTHKRQEKDDTLKLALKIREYLEIQNYKVVLSRDDDSSVDRYKRGEMANKSGARIMLSLHRNKSPDSGNGIEIYTPSKNDNKSNVLARKIMDNLVEVGFSERNIRAGTLTSSTDDYPENANLKMPSCLIEVGFISDAKDNKLFDDNLAKNAKAIADAIDDSFIEFYEDK